MAMSHAAGRRKPGRSSAAGLLRLLAAYLALILGLQGVAAAHALGSGPLHHHREAPASVAAALFSHQAHAHGSSERHHHDEANLSVLPDRAADDGIDAAAFALTAALALLALGAIRVATDARRHVWRPAADWAFLTGFSTLLFEPPRHG